MRSLVVKSLPAIASHNQTSYQFCPQTSKTLKCLDQFLHTTFHILRSPPYLRKLFPHSVQSFIWTLCVCQSLHPILLSNNFLQKALFSSLHCSLLRASLLLPATIGSFLEKKRHQTSKDPRYNAYEEDFAENTISCSTSIIYKLLPSCKCKPLRRLK